MKPAHLNIFHDCYSLAVVKPYRPMQQIGKMFLDLDYFISIITNIRLIKPKSTIYSSVIVNNKAWAHRASLIIVSEFFISYKDFHVYFFVEYSSCKFHYHSQFSF